MNRIKIRPANLLLYFLFFLICQITSAAPHPTFASKTRVYIAKNKSVKLFTVGNSFSQNALTYLPNIADEKGYKLTVGRAVIGGSSLKRHWEHVLAYEANPEDVNGKPYNGKSLKMLLSEDTWDIITMQQFSGHSSDVDTYRPYAQLLYNYIKKLQPQAEIVLHQTWSYRYDAPVFGQIRADVNASSSEEMWLKSRAAYKIIAQELGGLRIIPTGDAFWEVSSHPKWDFKKDNNFNYENPVYPTLPNQINSLYVGYRWNGDKKLVPDFKHGSPAGCFLGSLVWYSFLFNESPSKVKFVPEEVQPDFAKFLRNVAKATIKNRKNNS